MDKGYYTMPELSELVGYKLCTLRSVLCRPEFNPYVITYRSAAIAPPFGRNLNLRIVLSKDLTEVKKLINNYYNLRQFKTKGFYVN